MPFDTEIRFTLNGVEHRATVGVDMSALEMLRDVIGLTGTKYGCGEGECGACTIIVDGRSVNSCLLFALDCDGRALTTIEGLAATRTRRRCGRPSSPTARCSAASARRAWWCRPATCWRPSRSPTPPPSSGRSKATCAAAPATRRSSTRSSMPGSRSRPGARHERHAHAAAGQPDRPAHPEDGRAREGQRPDALHRRHRRCRDSCTRRSCARRGCMRASCASTCRARAPCPACTPSSRRPTCPTSGRSASPRTTCR